MNKLLRYLSLCLLGCLLLCQAAGCGGTGTPEPTEPVTDEPAQTEEPELPPEAVLVRDGKLSVTIVRPENAAEKETEAAVAIRKSLQTLYPDGEIQITDDFVKDGAYDTETTEIFVGTVNRPETQKVLNGLRYGDAAIRVVGHKIVVVSWTDVAYNTLNDKLFAAIAACPDRANVTLTDAANTDVSVNEALNTIPVLQDTLPDNVRATGDKAYELFFADASAAYLESYAAALKTAGFTCKQDRTVGANRFTVFTGSGTAVTAYYTDTNHSFRIITEPESNFCDAPAAEVKAVTTPMLTMIGRRFSKDSTYLGEDSGAGLMCFLLRLSDGRFIVIDGGVSDNGLTSFATAIYAKMLEQAPDSKHITVAAWVLTHSHSDHVGGFKSFLDTYKSVVTVESILYNFPSDADTAAASDESNSVKNVKSAISAAYPKTPVYKIHTGQQYNFADALVEVYYTHEDFVAKKRVLSDVTNNWNNSSCIFSVNIAGQKLMFLGDAQETANNMTAAIFGSYLKSDIVQIAHHGGIGGTRAIYTAVDADVGLFTTNDPLLSVYINKWDYNFHAVANLHMKEYFNSCDRITTFSLPYTPKSQTTPAVFVKTTKN